MLLFDLTSAAALCILINMNSDTETFTDVLATALNATMKLLESAETLEDEIAIVQALSALKSLQD